MPYIAHANSGHENFFLIPPDGFDEKSLDLPVEEYHAILPDMLMNLKTLLYKPIDPSIIPTHLMVSVRLSELPDYIAVHSVGYIHVVSERLRALFEELEPGLHQFVPVTILRSPDDAYAGSFFYLVPQTLAQGMIPERSPAAKIEDDDDGWRVIKMNPKYDAPYDYVFDASIVGDLHYWEEASDARKKTGTTYHITGKLVSDAFKERFEAAGMTGLAFGRRQPFNTEIDAEPVSRSSNVHYIAAKPE